MCPRSKVGIYVAGSFSGFRRGFNPSRELSSNSFFKFVSGQMSFFFVSLPHENQLFSVFFSFATAARLMLALSFTNRLFVLLQKNIYFGTPILSSFIDRRISFFHFTHWVFFIWRPDNSRNTVFRNRRGFRGDWVSETLVDS